MPQNPTEIGLRVLTREANEVLANMANIVAGLVAAVGDLNARLVKLEPPKGSPPQNSEQG